MKDFLDGLPIWVFLFVSICLFIVMICSVSSPVDYTITAKCCTWEGCGYTKTIPLHLDENGLIIPPEDRFCPKCGKLIIYESEASSITDVNNQFFVRRK